MKNIKILSADLSLTGSAFALSIYYDKRLIVTQIYFVNNKKNIREGIGKRLLNIADTLEEILQEHNDIDYIVRERGFSCHAATTQTLFKVVGIFDLMCFKYIPNLKIEEITPTDIKKTLTGTGKADKKTVEEHVRKYTRKDIEFETDDCSDALAVSIAFAIKNGILNQK